jgi:hypothetical protein
VPAWLAGYGLKYDRLRGGLTMGEVLLIDFATCAAVIVVAVVVMVMVRRRRSDQARASDGRRRGPVAELAEQGTSGRDVACVPGFSHATREQDSGPDTPAAPEQAPVQTPEAQVSGAADPDLDSAAHLDSDALSAQLEEPQAAAGASSPDVSTGGASPPDEAPAGASTAGASSPDERTTGERIGAYYEGYYDEADQPVAGYLAALGWPQEPGTPGEESGT